MDKKQLSESDICDKFIRPAMEAAGWNGMDQIYREFPLRAGRAVVRGQKSFRDKTTVVRADYALFHKPNIPLAAVEAKDTSVNRLQSLCADLRRSLAARQTTEARLAEALIDEVS